MTGRLDPGLRPTMCGMHSCQISPRPLSQQQNSYTGDQKERFKAVMEERNERIILYRQLEPDVVRHVRLMWKVLSRL